MEFALETDQSLSVVDNTPFRRLLLYMRGAKAKESDIPHRTKFTQMVLSKAEVITAQLTAELKVCSRLFLRFFLIFYAKAAPGRISFTFDGWTSSTMTAYLAVTVHWITTNWILRSELLSFSELEGSHSGENQAELLYRLVKKTGIEDKVCRHGLCFCTPY